MSRILLFLFTAVSLTHCSTVRIPEPTFGFETAEQQGSVSKIWGYRLPGLATDLNLSEDGQRILISMVPDPEHEYHENIRQPALALLNEHGKTMWRLPQTQRIKWQSISNSGQLMVITTMDGKLQAISGEGKTLWTRDNYCRPIILNRPSRILCYRSDDAKPSHVGFEIYDFKGNKLQTFQVSPELLELSISSDEKYAVLALAGGKVVLVELSRALEIWRADLPGQAAAVSVSSNALDGNVFAAAVFHQRNGSGRHSPYVGILVDGRIVQSLEVPGQFDQIAMNSGGERIILYGNNPRGQTLVHVKCEELPSSDHAHFKLTETWRKHSPLYSDYSSQLFIASGRIIAGFEDSSLHAESGRAVVHLFGFDQQGKVEWSVPLVGEEGGYLFSYSKNPANPRLIAISDIGEISAYRLENPANNLTR